MNRLHIHVSVDALEPSIAFYSALFGQQPSVLKDDYAKWEVEDPRVNFAISDRAGSNRGVNHLGIEAESAEELDQLQKRLEEADIASKPEDAAHCCYAKSDKHWAQDPSAVVWEMFHTMGEAQTYGEDNAPIANEPPVEKVTSHSCC